MIEHVPFVLVLGWVVRMPLLSRDEGHEAITRAAFEGLDLTDAQQAALVRGVRAPDVSLRGLASFVLPARQPRHALRAHASTTTEDGIAEMRAWVDARHRAALATADERMSWEGFGEILHCLQDAYSTAHVDRDGARILRMKHWGPLDRWRTAGGGSGVRGDEHGFPADRRDRALIQGELTDAARAAAEVSRRYLELALEHAGNANRPADALRRDMAVFLDDWVTGTSTPRPINVGAPPTSSPR